MEILKHLAEDMGRNSITGLPNAIDRDAAANKNYVDNGGAIAKIQMVDLPRLLI